MTVLENFKTRNIDELAEWFDKYIAFDDAPWWKYWDKNYCNRCEAVITCVPEFDEYEHKVAYCELNGNCKHFKEIDEIPDNKHIIKLWLESKAE